jgi:hypothetical protein
MQAGLVAGSQRVGEVAVLTITSLTSRSENLRGLAVIVHAAREAAS